MGGGVEVEAGSQKATTRACVFYMTGRATGGRGEAKENARVCEREDQDGLCSGECARLAGDGALPWLVLLRTQADGGCRVAEKSVWRKARAKEKVERALLPRMALVTSITKLTSPKSTGCSSSHSFKLQG